MKLKFNETIEREVELTVPCYRKSDFWVVKIVGEKEYIQVNRLDEEDTANEYHISHRTNAFTGIDTFFNGDYTEATEEEFTSMLRETKRRLLTDVNEQIFQQEKAA